MAQATQPTNAPTPQPADNEHVPTLGAEILDDTGSWLQNNMKPLLYVVGGIIAIVCAVVGYKAWQASQNDEAQREMFGAMYYFEADSLNKALKGDGQAPGFEAISEDYAGTASGQLANFYKGAIYLKQGKFDQAIEALEGFSADDILVQARAYSLLGDAYSEKNDYENAAANYLKAANHRPNKFFTPGYLMKLAVVQESQKDFKGAVATYDRIIKEYFESSEASDARKFKARAQGLAGGDGN